MGEVYTKDPADVVFDDKYVIFNPLHNDLEYAGTKAHIEALGQLDPILMLDGKCIDGRHRTRAAKELGTYVRCIDVAPAEETELILLCNKNTMGGRDFDNTQKAIQALKLVNDFGMTAVAAAKHMKVHKVLVTYAATIKGYGRLDILELLMGSKSNKVQLDVMERPSRSLELLAKFVKAEKEQGIVVDDSERIQWKPDALIKTEVGKAWFYEQLQAIEAVGKSHYERLLVELTNLKFKDSVDA